MNDEEHDAGPFDAAADWIEEKAEHGEEYAPDDHDGLADEPGIPDEMVKEIGAEPAELFGLNVQLLLENSPILAMVLIAVALTETVKALGLRTLARRKKWHEDTKETIYRMVLFVVSASVATTFGFRLLVLDVVGVQISHIETMVYGGALVSVSGAFLYSMKMTRVLKNWIYGKFGTSEAELRTTEQPGLTEDE